MEIAIVGATGLVGSQIIKVLAESELPISRIWPVASARSVGNKKIVFRQDSYDVVDAQTAIAAKPAFAIFSAGGGVSLELAPLFAQAGIRVIDNSSAWRMDTDKKLIVPEINADALTNQDFIIANPNCSTIQMVVALKPLHDAYTLKRVVVSTYQSVTGTGQKALDQLMAERAGQSVTTPAYPHPIDLNLIPHIDSFLDNGYTKEEMKMINETRKIMSLPHLAMTATTVRVPVIGGHSESINVEFENEFDLKNVRQLLANAPGVVLQDEPSKNIYPMPISSHERNEVFVGRLRRDESQPCTLNMWVVADNLRKGAASNAIQIAEFLYKKGWF